MLSDGGTTWLQFWRAQHVLGCLDSPEDCIRKEMLALDDVDTGKVDVNRTDRAKAPPGKVHKYNKRYISRKR